MSSSSAGKFRRIGTLATINRSRAESGVETTGATEAIEAEAVGADVVNASVSALQDHIARVRGGSGQMTDSDRALIETGRRAGEKLVAEGATAHLSPSEEAALEAIAVADGSRPALLLRDDTFDPHDATIGDWSKKLQGISDALKAASQSVGRVNLGGEHLGTGWIVRPGYAVTNRHVAQELCKNPQEKKLTFGPPKGATISFGHQTGEAVPRPAHSIEAIVFAGEDYIDPFGDNKAKLDLAILRLARAPDEALPPPLPSFLLPAEQTVAGRDVFVIGYPGPAFPRSDLPESVVLSLIGSAVSLKRLSPGEIALPAGTVAGDTKSRTIAHDATTLGGSSGSAILGFDQAKKPLMLGLHFGGYEVKYGPGGVIKRRGRNFAHSFAAMQDVIAAVDAAIAKDRTEQKLA